ncbi:hypothetical protein AYL99_05906 [Fonsecaea erecta]|uniref:RING-type domain-containing protein n=1 Tax=Fonsecaea erecta TaxID=1367422 RepID=A0A178ZM64_9EURO|nr:hypothetical protein AYL99_05906 [Fonsecaea erecta]OAP60904.1 hypothetical protein AYL99_05906 [Fonsecaea erecta]
MKQRPQKLSTRHPPYLRAVLDPGRRIGVGRPRWRSRREQRYISIHILCIPSANFFRYMCYLETNPHKWQECQALCKKHHLNVKSPRPKCSVAPETYFAALPSLWAYVKDMYALTLAVLNFTNTLGHLLERHEDGIRQDKLDQAMEMYGDAWVSLWPKVLLGFRTPEEFFKTATIEKYSDVVRRLAAAEAQVTLFLARLSTVELCVWTAEEGLLRSLATVEDFMGDEDEAEGRPNGPWYSRFQVYHRWTLQTRAACRDRLFREIDKLSTPRLRALDYRRDFFCSLLEEEPVAGLGIFSTSTPGLSRFADNLSFRVLAQPPVDRENTMCPICQEKLSVDPTATTGEQAKKQLLIYTHKCCNRPYHVCCLLQWLDQHQDPSYMTGSCPTCRHYLGYDFAKDLLERRIVELGTL